MEVKKGPVGNPYDKRDWVQCSGYRDRAVLLRNIEQSIKKWREIQFAFCSVKLDGIGCPSAIDAIVSTTCVCGMCKSFRRDRGCHLCPLFVDSLCCYQRGDYQDIFYALNALEKCDDLLFAVMLYETVERIEGKVNTYSKELVEYLDGLAKHLKGEKK